MFQSWRLVSVGPGPGEGDMTFGGDGVVSSRAREERLAPVSGRAVKAGACDGRIKSVCVCVAEVRRVCVESNARGVAVACGEACVRWCGSGLECAVEQVEVEAASRPVGGGSRTLLVSLAGAHSLAHAKGPVHQASNLPQLGWIKRDAVHRRDVHLRSRAELVHHTALAVVLATSCLLLLDHAALCCLPRSTYESHIHILTAIPRVACCPVWNQTKQHLRPHPAKATDRKGDHHLVYTDPLDRRRNTALSTIKRISPCLRASMHKFLVPASAAHDWLPFLITPPSPFPLFAPQRLISFHGNFRGSRSGLI